MTRITGLKGSFWRSAAAGRSALALLAVAGVAVVVAAVASGTDTSPRNLGTAVNDSSFGTAAWSSLTNGTTSNDAWIIATPATNATTQYLKATNFGFTVPAGATINGVTVNIERSESGSPGDVRDASVKLVKGGAVVGNDKAKTTLEWDAGTDGTATYGSSSDLWGTTLTDTDVNSSTFGVAIAAKQFATAQFARVDTVTIVISYTTGGGGGATSWTATNYSRTVFQDPAGIPYTAWTGAWKNPADGSLWMAFTESSGTQTSFTPSWAATRLGGQPSQARDHWALTNTTAYYKSTDHGATWAVTQPNNNAADVMRTWNPAVNDCPTTGTPTGQNCPSVHPIPFTPQANIQLANGDLIRRVNGEDVKYDTAVKVTAYIQRLTPGAGHVWGAPEYLLDPTTCSCTYQISRIRRLADGRLIALGGKWDAYNPKGSVGHLLLMVGDSTGHNWVSALSGTGMDTFSENEWDAAELPNGDLIATFRTSDGCPNCNRRQALLHKSGSAWTFASTDVKTPPFAHSGHPELLETSAGAVLYIATDDTSGQKGIWYLSNTNAQANSTVWTKLPFATGGTDCVAAGTKFNCSSRYYPRSFEDCNAGTCTIFIFSHTGSDDDYWEVNGHSGVTQVNESIILQKFTLTSP